jgi:26S proteasome regulatory subunit N9
MKGILESSRRLLRYSLKRFVFQISKVQPWTDLGRIQPILQENYAFLQQKICLMALIESVFKRNSDNRTMSFQTIAEETRLPVDEVEHLVMKALR